MKRFFTLILISAFLFPVLGHAAAAPTDAVTPVEGAVQTTDTTPLTVSPADINAKFQDILSRFSDLSLQTQTTIDQLSLNGVDTTAAQAALDNAKVVLTKAKSTITTEKYSRKTVESQISDIKSDMLQSLALLEASLPTLTQPTQ